eukprot:gene19142-19509_t
MSSTKLANIDKRGLVKSFVPEEKALARGNLAGSALIFPNNTISFELFPTNIQGDWSNIFRFAFNSTDIGIGDRAPGVWFTPGNLKLHWRYSTDTDPNWGHDAVDPPLIKNKWTKVDLVFKDGVATVFLDGHFAAEKSSNPATRSWISPGGTFHQVWISDPFYNPAAGLIRNLTVRTPLSPGRTVAIFSPVANRFLSYTDEGKGFLSEIVTDKNLNPNNVAEKGGVALKFSIEDAGNDQLFLHHVQTKHYLRITDRLEVDTNMQSMQLNKSDSGYSWERFMITDLQDEYVSISTNNRYLAVTGHIGGTITARI